MVIAMTAVRDAKQALLPFLRDLKVVDQEIVLGQGLIDRLPDMPALIMDEDLAREAQGPAEHPVFKHAGRGEDHDHGDGTRQADIRMPDTDAHPDGRNDPDRSRRGEPDYSSTRLDDGPAAEKTNTRDDLSRDPSGIAIVTLLSQTRADQDGNRGIERGPHADQNIGLDPSGLVFELPLQSDEPSA